MLLEGDAMLTLALLLLASTPTQSPPPDASASRRGLLNTTSQTIGGLKTFLDGGIVADLQAASTYSGQAFETATVGTMSLFADPVLGNDANACTASGVAACLTLGGALQKIPNRIRHAVTVTLANGTYSEVFRVQGFRIQGANGAASTAALTIQGAETNFVVATGSATGTLTAYNLSVGGAHATATDSGATWTVDNLKGRFLQIVTGTGAGQYMPIVSNTATVITLASNFTTAPVAGSTYAIMTPGPVFTGTTGRIENINGGGTLTVNDVSLQSSSGSGIQVNDDGFVTMTRVRIVGVTTAHSLFTASAAGPTAWTFNQSYLAGGAAGFVIPPDSRTSLVQTLVACTDADCSTGVGVSNSSRSSSLANFTGTVAGNFAALLRFIGPPGFQSTGLWLDCGTSTNIGIDIPAPTDTSVQSPGQGVTANVGPYITGCGVGYQLQSLSQTYIDNGTVFNAVTTAVLLNNGARAIVEAGITYTGVTNQFSVDGTIYTDANLTAAANGSIGGNRGSYLTRP